MFFTWTDTPYWQPCESQWFSVVVSSASCQVKPGSVCENWVLVNYLDRKLIISGALICFSVSSNTVCRNHAKNFWLRAAESPCFQERGEGQWKMWELAEFLQRWLGPRMGWTVFRFWSHQPSYPVWADGLELPRFRAVPAVPHKPCSHCQRCINLILWFSLAWIAPVVEVRAALLLWRNTRELTASLCTGQIIYSKPSCSSWTAVTHIPEHH